MFFKIFNDPLGELNIVKKNIKNEKNMSYFSRISLITSLSLGFGFKLFTFLIKTS